MDKSKSNFKKFCKFWKLKKSNRKKDDNNLIVRYEGKSEEQTNQENLNVISNLRPNNEPVSSALNSKMINNLNHLNDDSYINSALNKKLENLMKKDQTSFTNHLICPIAYSLLIHSHSHDCVMPELIKIIQLSFFYPEIDRFKAEELLSSSPDGTFLLRNSSHPNHLFSVSFRSHHRSLHARIEKENGQYSFDSKDVESQKFNSVIDLFNNYKDTKRYIFEPILINPLKRTTTHTLKQLSQYTILSMCNYHNINLLPIPNVLKEYLNSFNYCSDSKE